MCDESGLSNKKERYGGIYDCSDGSWVVKGFKCCECHLFCDLARAQRRSAPKARVLSMPLRVSRLCAGPRAEQAKGNCGGKKPCVALMVDDPT